MMSTSARFLSSFLALYTVSFLALPTSSRGTQEHYARSLLKFKQSLTNATMLDNWKESSTDTLCSNNIPNWTGCLCYNGSFVGLRLEGMGLGGRIDVDSLSGLSLFSLSVANNDFSGPFPSDINKLLKLRVLYLMNNKFNGEIGGDAFSGMKALRKVVLSGNSFTGNIPMSLVELPRLVDLELQRNGFEGRIPDFLQENLTVNFSYNNLKGPIPVSLSNQNANSFLGKWPTIPAPNGNRIPTYIYISHYRNC